MRALLYLLLPLTLCFTACENWKKKDPLPGERKAIFQDENTQKSSSTVTHVKVHIPHAQANRDWDQSGFQASHFVPNLALAAQPQQVWQATLGHGGAEQRLIANLVVHEDRLYGLDASSQVVCLNARDGAPLWTKSTMPETAGAEAMGGGLAYDKGMVFATTSLGDVFALSAATGEEKWRSTVGAPIRMAPTVSDGRLYVTTVNNEVMALDDRSGNILWTHTGIPEAAGILGGGSPAVKDGVVVVALTSGEIYALSATTGAVLWSETLVSSSRIDSIASIPHVRARPVIHDDIVYLVSHGGRAVALGLKTGERFWQQDIGGIHTPVIIGSYIYLVDNQSQLICLDRHQGTVAWIQELPQSAESSSRVHWAGPTPAGNALLLAGTNGEVVFINPENGVKAASVQTDNLLTHSPVVAGGMLYVLGDGGTVTAWR